MALASEKALKMRGYDFGKDELQHTVEESVDNKNINPEAIPDNLEGENNYGMLGDTVATGYNLAKTVSDFVVEALPIAETVINPVGEYSGLYDYANTLFTTDLQAADFQKI